ncbi:sulfur carrier protein ThiS [Salisaeta longa]|uniref:sulfur carrier protein ThiS n=1 Tax=Salisaeta longa TaxID=503170 RepID=UPI0003B71CF4|nr:sulfur carrier protein ThiS [Salisaeta longa]
MSASEPAIPVTVNGEPREVPAGATVSEVLRQLDIDPEETTGVAVAVNESVVPRGRWAESTIGADDTVEVIQALQGG